MCRKRPGREQDPGKSLFSGGGGGGLEVPGAFYSPDTDYEAIALVGPPPSNVPGWG